MGIPITIPPVSQGEELQNKKIKKDKGKAKVRNEERIYNPPLLYPRRMKKDLDET